MKTKMMWLGLIAVLCLLPSTVVFADEPGFTFDDGQIFLDEDVTLEPGETFDGDLGVFDGNLTIPEGSVVNGDVFVTNGDIDLGGRVDGDLAVINGALDLAESGQTNGDVFGMGGALDVAGRVDGDLSILFGNIYLRSTARVNGDLLVLSGSVEREPGARVTGEEVANIPLPSLPIFPENLDVPEIPDLPELPAVPRVPEVPRLTPPEVPMVRSVSQPTLGQRIGQFIGRAFTATLLGLLFVGIGLLVVFIWPRATRTVSECIRIVPVQSLGLGLLTFLIAAGLEALAAVLMIVIILIAAVLIGTVILIPIGLLLILLSVLVLLPVPLALAGAMVMGWVGLAELIGQRVLRYLKVERSTAAGAVFVGLLLTVGMAATLWIIQPACCAWPFIILLTSVGLGAVIHTRFGSQSCQSTDQPEDDAEPLPLDAMDEEAGQPDTA